MTALEARVDAEGVLWLAGEIDMSVSSRFETAAIDALDGEREFVIDLSGVSFLDSTGIRTILKIAEKTSSGVCLRQPDPSVRRVLDLTGVVGRRGIRIVDH